jgi:hypothetical protein
VHSTTATIFTSVGWSFGICGGSSSKPVAQGSNQHAVDPSNTEATREMLHVSVGDGEKFVII